MADQNEMLNILIPMMEHICDKLCRFPWEITDQEEMNQICHECKMNQYEQEAKDTYNQIAGKERQWIPVSEKLPSSGGIFETTIKRGKGKAHIEMCEFFRKANNGNGRWGRSWNGENVLAWRERDKPYRPEGQRDST